VLGTALSPYLLVKHPLLLVALSASAPNVAMAAANAEPIPLIAIATLRRTLTGLASYGLGHLYGDTALGWLEQRFPSLARLLRFAERSFARFGVALLLIAPAPTLALLAGAARSRLLFVLPALALGHVFWNTLTQYLGGTFARSTELLTAFLGEHLLEATLACVLAVALQQGTSRWLRRKRER
jgi:membrane protein YqaA with SNARE-associated domain